MTTDYKVTEIFCAIDEFCKKFDAEMANQPLLTSNGKSRRLSKVKLSDSEIMNILLLFHFSNYRDFKHYYVNCIRIHHARDFPEAVSYNRFVELENRVFYKIMLFLSMAAFGKCSGITFVDSTMIPVCHNMRRNFNRVCCRSCDQWQGYHGLVSRIQTALSLQ